MRNNTKKKIGPIVVAAIVVLYVAPLVVMVAMAAGFLGANQGMGVVPFLLLYAAVGGAVILGVLAAMAQRLKEIDGGEEDEASKY